MKKPITILMLMALLGSLYPAVILAEGDGEEEDDWGDDEDEIPYPVVPISKTTPLDEEICPMAMWDSGGRPYCFLIGKGKEFSCGKCSRDPRKYGKKSDPSKKLDSFIPFIDTNCPNYDEYNETTGFHECMLYGAILKGCNNCPVRESITKINVKEVKK